MPRASRTLPTLDLLVQQGAKIILAAHLGRPKGQREPAMSLRPVAAKLADMISRPVAFVDDCIGEKVEKTVGRAAARRRCCCWKISVTTTKRKPTIRRLPKSWRKLADVYVNDAFGAAHRAHASTEGVARVIAKRGGQCAAGLLMERELKFLGEELEKPGQPLCRHPRRRQSFGQDQGHRPSAG